MTSVILGALLTAIYVVWCLKIRSTLAIKTVVVFFLSSNGFVGGSVLVVASVYPAWMRSLDDLSLWLAIAGSAVLLVSLQSIANEFKGLSESAAEEPVRQAADSGHTIGPSDHHE